MQRRTLRDIGEDLLALEQILEDVGGDITEADAEAAIDQWLAEIGDDLNRKLDAYVTVIKEAEVREHARRDEAERLLVLAGFDAGIAYRLRARLLYFMTNVSRRSEIQTDHYRVRAVNSGGKLPLEITDTIPEEYWGVRPVRYVDHERIRRELEAGAELPFAKLGERGRRIAIR